MFSWFKRRSERLQPEAQWHVAIDDEKILVSDQNGKTKSLTTMDLKGVIIETNDTGPWGVDVWWFLFGADDQLACAFPQGATGEQAMLDYLMALGGFDHAQMVAAMASTQNAVFPVWRASS